MIVIRRLSAPRTATACAAASLSLAALSASAAQQTMQVPASPRPSPRPAWNCRAQASVGTTEIRAARLLDAAGARLQDGAGWTDTFTADKRAPLTVSVEWRGESNPITFAEGMANFWVRNAQPLKWPLKMSVTGRRTIAFDAGQAYMNPREFSAYERIGKVLDAAGDATALTWALRGTVGGKSGMAVANEGSYALAELVALKPAFATVLTQLDAMQADFVHRCRRL